MVICRTIPYQARWHPTVLLASLLIPLAINQAYPTHDRIQTPNRKHRDGDAEVAPRVFGHSREIIIRYIVLVQERELRDEIDQLIHARAVCEDELSSQALPSMRFDQSSTEGVT